MVIAMAGATMVALTLHAAAPAAGGDGPLGIEPRQTQIYDGTPVQTCQFPTTAMLGFGGCTATLVNPWIVITAAHCVGNVDNPGNIFLGETFGSPDQSLPVEYCHRNPDYDPNFNNGVNGSDISYCKLKSPVYDVPFTPIIYGCEEEIITFDREAWIVGIGANAEDGSGFGVKRYSQSRISFVPMDLADGVRVGDVLDAACSGDSGGPAFVQYPDGSWHVFGVTSGGPSPCGSGADTYAVMSVWVPWIEEDSGIDVTPCHDVDGTWNPTGWCQGFEIDALDADRAWADYCLGEVSGPSATCGPAFDANPDDTPPTVTLASPADDTVLAEDPARVQLVIEADDGDGHGIRAVRIAVDGAEQAAELREAPYELDANFPTGVYEITALAEDWAGNVGTSAPVRIAVNTELPPPAEPTTGDVDSSGTGDGDGGTTGSPPATSGDDTDPDPSMPARADQSDGGCGCRSEPSRRGGAWLLMLTLGGLGGRRRSSRPRGSARRR